ncbi:hypothetical protein MUU53_02630 [Rhizobium lemnae]|uniref:Uncharacterized protein n=1 Tax=Rhizobium lemnae TaxID=1214924 RepID=A0ABV8E8L1_9HYPH|nr:hypothetical protein [Rhizobium lemnae]MCJ8506803.1 hypothetical protein [Rhizobium lemnae]
MARPYWLIISIGIALSGVVIGAVIACLFLTTNGNLKQLDVNAFSSLLLSAISVIFTFFGVFVAVLAFFGFNIIKDGVESTSKAEIEKSVQDGLLKGHMHEIAKQETRTALQPGGSLHELAVDTLNRTYKQQTQPGGDLYNLAERLYRESVFRGIGIDESSGILDPKEEDL